MVGLIYHVTPVNVIKRRLGFFLATFFVCINHNRLSNHEWTIEREKTIQSAFSVWFLEKRRKRIASDCVSPGRIHNGFGFGCCLCANIMLTFRLCVASRAQVKINRLKITTINRTLSGFCNSNLKTTWYQIEWERETRIESEPESKPRINYHVLCVRLHTIIIWLKLCRFRNHCSRRPPSNLWLLLRDSH